MEGVDQRVMTAPSQEESLCGTFHGIAQDCCWSCRIKRMWELRERFVRGEWLSRDQAAIELMRGGEKL